MGHIQPQNTRPKTMVKAMTNRAGKRRDIKVFAASSTVAVTRGSQRKKMLTA